MNCFNPFAPGDFAERRALKLVELFSGQGGGGVPVISLTSWKGHTHPAFFAQGDQGGVQLVLNKSNGNLRVLSIQPKIPYISVGTSNGMDHFCLHWSSLTGLVILVSWTEMSHFHFTKLLSPEPLFCILFTRTVSKHAVAWIGSVQLECT